MKSSNFRTFVEAYLDCALWSSTAVGAPDMEEDDDTSMQSYGYTLDDIDSAERLKAILDCRDFYLDQLARLEKVGDFEQHGHDFWLTRNRHGAGFWDRGYGATGDKLTKAAHVFGGVNLHVGEDEKIYGFK